MRILFSGIGGSDPINSMIDGPMLHCCRVYKPDVVYLYFTKKMLDTENRDHRYTWAINKLGEKLNHKFEIIKIERPNCVDPHIFDTFFYDFEDIFNDIREKNPEAEIYANASSGTPAMKEAIVVIGAMSEAKKLDLKIRQVSSGEDGSVKREDHNAYDVEEQWNYNLDNTDAFEDRTRIVKSPAFIVKIKKENIRRHIEAYDYSAAAALAENIKEDISPEVLGMIKAAEERYKLNYPGVCKCIPDASAVIPIKSDSGRSFAEYMLWLGVTLKRNDYLSFMRGITPAAMELMEKAFFNIAGDVKQYCRVKGADHYILSVDILKKTNTGQIILGCLNTRFGGKYQDREYTTAQLEAVIEGMSGDEKLKKYAKTIRTAEEKIRNKAAHTIISIDDSFIKREIGISADELYDCMKKMAVKLGLVNKNIWDSYEKMNELILKKL
ncbi:MAG: hypothetical protein LUG66_03010 [Clostridiales bacterium]|nr:hypothetical protein [Clostridiales bacterium]